VVLVAQADAEDTSPALVLAYTAAYAVGSLLSYAVLRGRLGGLGTARSLEFLARLAFAVAVSTAAAVGTAAALHEWIEDPHWVVAAGMAAVTTAADAIVFIVLARAMQMREVTAVLDTVTRRLARSRDA
jgi:putative peptidoglycan lipid II flippase